MTEAYPLRWPDGWPKTAPAKRDRGSKFMVGGYHGNLPSFAKGRAQLMEQLRLLGAHSVVISSGVDVRADGVTRQGVNADRLDMKEPGVAVYFTFNNKQMVMAQDTFDSPGCNLRSLVLAVTAMRSLERHGGRAMMSRGFDGFAALPPPQGSKPKLPWWDVLKYPADPTEREFLSTREVEARYTALAKRAHPDAGGSHEAMAELNVARDDAVAELSQEGR